MTAPASNPTYSVRYIPTSRLAGPDRYGTSAAAAALYPAHQAVVYVASGTDFPDAAAAAAIAGQQHAPMLLVEPTAIPSSISTQLTRLAPNRIVVLGGEAAVSASVFDQLKAFTSPTPDQVTRAPGADRYATAADLADSVFASGVGTVVVVSGLGFADAVSAAPLAALDGAPVLYVEPGSVPTSVQDALHDTLKPTHIVIVGGLAAVSQAVADSLHALTGVTPSRVAGADRYATAEQVALQVAGGAHPAAVYVASGLAFPDALTAAVLAGSAGDPVLLAGPLAAAADRDVRRHERDAAAGRHRARRHGRHLRRRAGGAARRQRPLTLGAPRPMLGPHGRGLSRSDRLPVAGRPRRPGPGARRIG